jgi:hypothetical protein
VYESDLTLVELGKLLNVWVVVVNEDKPIARSKSGSFKKGT